MVPSKASGNRGLKSKGLTLPSTETESFSSSSVVSGYEHTCAIISTDRDLLCWDPNCLTRCPQIFGRSLRLQLVHTTIALCFKLYAHSLGRHYLTSPRRSSFLNTPL
eukprot:9180214-Prorocentrum_lima.AAC.1